jgi:hypothetical protein
LWGQMRKVGILHYRLIGADQGYLGSLIEVSTIAINRVMLGNARRAPPSAAKIGNYGSFNSFLAPRSLLISLTAYPITILVNYPVMHPSHAMNQNRAEPR